MKSTVTLLSVHPKALEHYDQKGDVVEAAKALPLPLKVDFYSEIPYNSISNERVQYFTDSIIEEYNFRDDDDDRPNTWSLAWFVTDNDEINVSNENYWKNIK